LSEHLTVAAAGDWLMTAWVEEVGLEVRERLRKLDARGSPGLGARIAEVFLCDTAIRLAALRDAIARRDGEAAYRIAHTLEGSAAMIGAASMARSCNELTESARSGAFDVCEILLADLDAGFDAIQRAVKPEGSSANSL
jgi:HPt (histidine-containing phosphotransfer) domain-containing protein